MLSILLNPPPTNNTRFYYTHSLQTTLDIALDFTTPTPNKQQEGKQQQQQQQQQKKKKKKKTNKKKTKQNKNKTKKQNKNKNKKNKRAKMTLYRSPDYQIKWPFGSASAKYISEIAALAAVLEI